MRALPMCLAAVILLSARPVSAAPNAAELVISRIHRADARCMTAEALAVAHGRIVFIYQWNYTNGNEPDARYPTLHAALDREAPGAQQRER